jgi:hypothetical protein
MYSLAEPRPAQCKSGHSRKLQLENQSPRLVKVSRVEMLVVVHAASGRQRSAALHLKRGYAQRELLEAPGLATVSLALASHLSSPGDQRLCTCDKSVPGRTLTMHIHQTWLYGCFMAPYGSSLSKASTIFLTCTFSQTIFLQIYRWQRSLDSPT